VRRHLFITTVPPTPEALLRLIRRRWSIENEWRWARDTHLGDDAHRYASRIDAPVFSLL
jgi:predicted transposase YbfD/YdcC